jgi:hypothetical protein
MLDHANRVTAKIADAVTRRTQLGANGNWSAEELPMPKVQRFAVAVASFAILTVPSIEARAQGGVGMGYTDIGAVVGLGNTGGAGIALGGRFEKIFKSLPDMNNGLLGFQIGADWWSWSQSYLNTSSSVSYIPIGVTANYHFKMDNTKIDPFVGAGLGYQIVNASCVVNGTDYCGSYSSAIYFIAKAGIRYFLNASTALYADAGAGAATLSVGAVFKMKSGS